MEATMGAKVRIIQTVRYTRTRRSRNWKFVSCGYVGTIEVDGERIYTSSEHPSQQQALTDAHGVYSWLTADGDDFDSPESWHDAEQDHHYWGPSQSEPQAIEVAF
jgi:hypothetical protein